MVTLSKPTFVTMALIASLLAPQVHGWSVGLWSTANSCGQSGAADTTRGGDSAVSSSCQGFGFNEIQAIEVTDWADNCKIVAYDSWSCDNVLEEFTKDKYPPSQADPNWTCINNLRNHENLVNWQAFKYECA
ncbi:uncharacterized protein EI97DRAFT_429880 [Westerdykella ornata]|uniref:Avirulence Effector AvrLm4-7 domain-containing protein n=1 Tax=Westerdykella ornata TaxID=318751 RepID=A0A6A6JVJ2_WESOR|nr:uncharacterized protein EI97DRAFT_429880 [Westerdykella ornata]KAF2280123.1 hypothetical protein EI97DRAFT_429880 [Westerdykella ornata]